MRVKDRSNADMKFSSRMLEPGVHAEFYKKPIFPLVCDEKISGVFRRIPNVKI